MPGEILNKARRFSVEFSLSILRWLYPPNCSLCGTRDIHVLAFACETCWSRLERTDDLSTQNLWIVRERTQGLAISKFYAFLQFNRDAQKIIHEFKYNGRRRLAGEIIDHLSEEIVEIFATTTFDMIVPVPLHPKRIRERSYNQSELIAAEIAGLGSTSVDNTIVKRTRSTRSQTLLSASERHRNVSGAFEVNPDSKLEGKSVLLVDDLITTGATFNACALALSAAKADRVDALAIARA